MPSLCVIGNSHIGAIKLGWDAVFHEFPEWKLTFFGSQGESLASLESDDGFLSSADETVRAMFRLTSDGEDRIDLNRYDAFAVVGLGLATLHLTSIFSTHRPVQHATAKAFLISHDCLAAAVHGVVSSSIAVRTARTIRSESDAPVVLVPAPQPAIDILNDNHPQPHWLCDVELTNTAYRALLEAAAAIAANESSILVKQPEATLANGCYTKHTFVAHGVDLLGNTKPRGNLHHMGREYGAVVVPAILNVLADVHRQGTPAA